MQETPDKNYVKTLYCFTLVEEEPQQREIWQCTEVAQWSGSFESSGRSQDCTRDSGRPLACVQRENLGQDRKDSSTKSCKD